MGVCPMVYEKNAVRCWSERIEVHQASGKNAKIWCQENQVSYKSFLKWRSRLSSLEIKKGPLLIEIFEDSSEHTWMEITTKGAKLILARNFNRTSLIRLIEVLRELC